MIYIYTYHIYGVCMCVYVYIDYMSMVYTVYGVYLSVYIYTVTVYTMVSIC